MRRVVVKDWLGVRLGRKQLLYPRHVSNNNNKMVNSGYQMASIESALAPGSNEPAMKKEGKSFTFMLR